MTEALRVEIGVSDPGGCPVAETSAGTGSPVASASWTGAPGEDGTVAEEFTVQGSGTPAREDVSEVASYNTQTVYSFRREVPDPCVCQSIETFGFPVADVTAEDGTLFVTFHAPGMETVQEIVSTLQEDFAGIQLRKLTRSTGDERADLVFVDRSKLTERQREVLQTAHAMGYFEHPKGANAGEVAAELDISPSTFSEHLSAAQGKVLEAVLAN